MILQGYFIYIVLRDFLITLNVFIRGGSSNSRPNEAIIAVVLIHYFMSCLDNLVLSGLAIWGGIALNSLEAVEY